MDSRKAGTASAFDKNNGKRAVSYFWRRYARFVVARRTSAVAALLLAALYVFAYFGCRRMEVSFEPQKTFPTDSRLQDSVRVINRILTQASEDLTSSLSSFILFVLEKYWGGGLVLTIPLKILYAKITYDSF